VCVCVCVCEGGGERKVQGAHAAAVPLRTAASSQPCTQLPHPLCAGSQHLVCWITAPCVLDCSTLCAGSQHLVCWTTAPCVLDHSTLCAGSQHLVCWITAPCVLDHSTLCAGSQHLVCWITAPCVLDRSTLCAGSQHLVCWITAPCVLDHSTPPPPPHCPLPQVVVRYEPKALGSYSAVLPLTVSSDTGFSIQEMAVQVRRLLPGMLAVPASQCLLRLPTACFPQLAQASLNALPSPPGPKLVHPPRSPTPVTCLCPGLLPAASLKQPTPVPTPHLTILSRSTFVTFVPNNPSMYCGSFGSIV